MDLIEEILTRSKTIAIVGLSPKFYKPSHVVAKYLKGHGYQIIPVNPNIKTVLGETSYPDLMAIPERLDLADIFRRSDKVLPTVKQAITVGARYIWMQDGVVNEKAARLAHDKGIPVVMDNCTFREYAFCFGPQVPSV